MIARKLELGARISFGGMMVDWEGLEWGKRRIQLILNRSIQRRV
jgi:hypothetical protein